MNKKIVWFLSLAVVATVLFSGFGKEVIQKQGVQLSSAESNPSLKSALKVVHLKAVHNAPKKVKLALLNSNEDVFYFDGFQSLKNDIVSSFDGEKLHVANADIEELKAIANGDTEDKHEARILLTIVNIAQDNN